MYVGMLHCQHVAVVGPSVLTRIDLLPEFICNLEQHMQGNRAGIPEAGP